MNPPPGGYPPPPPLPPAAPPPFIPPARPSGGGGWRLVAIIFIVLFALSAIRNLARSAAPLARNRAATDKTHSLEEVYVERTNSTDNKVAVVTVDGIISSGEADRSGMSFQDFVKRQLRNASDDSDVKAVILKVDSPGGEVLASDEINKSIRAFQDDSHKPVVVSMGNLAASGGYYISVPARWIVANPMTITGSIGVIMHGYNYRHLMDKLGLRPKVYKSGRFKDMLSGEREPDDPSATPDDKKNLAEEDAMVQSLIDETYGKFKSVVQSGRDAAAKANGADGRTLIADWQQYADGRILSGQQAYDRGFVDELGNFDTAVQRAEKLTGINAASLVEYRVPVDLNSLLSHLMGRTDAPALKLDLGLDLEGPHLRAGIQYFILPLAVPQ